MNRLLSSSMLLAAALLVAGCGNSTSIGNGPYSALVGTYAFDEQVYTYFNSDGGTPCSEGLVAKMKSNATLKQIPSLPHRAQAVANMRGRKHSSSKVRSMQGDCNSELVWGANVGSLTFDGMGDVTSGELDFNEPTGTGYYTESVTGLYVVNSDYTADIQLYGLGSGDEYTYQVSLTGASASSVATGGQLLEAVSDNEGDIEMGSGPMMIQTTGLGLAGLSGNYVFGVQGQTCYGCTQPASGDIFAAGVLAANGAGSFGTTGEADIATGFATDNQVQLSGAYGAPDINGRITATLLTSGYGNGALPSGYAIYLVNASTAFLISTDQSSDVEAAPYIFGQMGLQSGSFSNTSLSGNYVLAESTEDLKNETTPDVYSDTALALLSATGGTLDGTGDTNLAGVVSSSVPFNYGTYTVAANGRVTLSGTTPAGAPAPVFWLQNSGFGYGVDQLGSPATPVQEPGLLYLYHQTATTVSGIYALGNLPSSTSFVGMNSSSQGVSVGVISGELTAGSGTTSGDGVTAFINGEEGGNINLGFCCVTSLDLVGNYTLASDGRATLTGNGGDSILGSEILYVVSANQCVAMDTTTGDSAPSLQNAVQ